MRQALTAAPLAPVVSATFDQLADPTHRRREPHEPIDPEPLSSNHCAESIPLASFPAGALVAPGPLGWLQKNCVEEKQNMAKAP